jgi:hypothetical protein
MTTQASLTHFPTQRLATRKYSVNIAKMSHIQTAFNIPKHNKTLPSPLDNVPLIKDILLKRYQ